MEIFTATSPESYDRHTYKIVMKNGKAIAFDDYKVASYHWYQYREHASHIEVLDVTGQGF